MIIEQILEDNKDLVLRYSDQKVKIHKIGTEEYYDEAIDLVSSPWTYEETDIKIDEEEGEQEEERVEE